MVDVRTTAEWNAGHSPFAKHMARDQLARSSTGSRWTRRLVVVCRSGSRSRGATKHLIAAGFDAVNLSGGMNAWVRQRRERRRPGGQARPRDLSRGPRPSSSSPALLIGLLLGVLGPGGAIFTAPVLIFGFDVPPREATTVSLVVVLLAAASGLLGHRGTRTVQWREGSVFGAVGIVAAVDRVVAGNRCAGTRADRSVLPCCSSWRRWRWCVSPQRSEVEATAPLVVVGGCRPRRRSDHRLLRGRRWVRHCSCAGARPRVRNP